MARYQAGESVKQLSRAIDASGDAILRLLEEEGVPRRFQPLTPKQLERVIELYEAGKSTYDIAEQLKIPKTTVGRALNKAGVSMRPRGRAAKRR